MYGRALRALVPAGLALLVVSQWSDIKRWLKIKQMDLGHGHPENVPAEGRKAYPPQPPTAPATSTRHTGAALLASARSAAAGARGRRPFPAGRVPAGQAVTQG